MSRFVTILALASVLAGCAFTDDTVAISYKPSDATHIADASPVILTIVDGRTIDRNRIGTKVNGYGMEMGAIRSATPVPEIVRAALTTEFERRGFQLDSSGRGLTIKIDSLFSHAVIGFLTVDIVGDVDLNVTVAAVSGSTLFSRVYTGAAKETVAIGTPSAHAEMVAAALKDAVEKMFGDRNFLQSLAPATGPKPGT